MILRLTLQYLNLQLSFNRAVYNIKCKISGYETICYISPSCIIHLTCFRTENMGTNMISKERLNHKESAGARGKYE
jgi:hypothetical protein